ncbi:hypothetical protein GYMLUDRAFT_33528 [Collybiopsis luxurians FD-317 M1]|nr:hypothetical protein GYMLUDRAFT_33528 [Collybiopsis luxurians FD-317 M1]
MAANSTSESSEISIRITKTGKMKHWITYALQCLEKDEKRPVVLHTLPRARKESDEAPEERPEQPENTKNTPNPANSLQVTPRLISVVEIIKREYLKHLDQTRSARFIGLHQYNEIGTLEELGLTDSLVETTDEQRAQKIAMSLEGKNFPKQRQSPYMKITLSVHELPELIRKGATYQKPLKRTLSKAAKKRAKANLKKSAQGNSASGPVDAGMDAS